MTDFYRTRMGVRFFEADLPELIKQLKRIADNLEKESEKAGDRDVPIPFLPVEPRQFGYKSPVKCADCSWEGELQDVRYPPENSLWERLDPGSEVPAGECPECGAFAYLKVCPWENNEIRFAWLLCEISANCDMQGYDKVLESMDLEEAEADELWEAAHEVFEKAKEDHVWEAFSFAEGHEPEKKQ